LTDGAFDITCNALFKLWKFDGSQLNPPADSLIDRVVNLIGYGKIVFDDESKSIYLPQKGMEIGFGAIGKGYAANRAKIIMQKIGVDGGIVNAGGDLTAWGMNDENELWKIGIQDPRDKNSVLSWLELSDMAVVTSGDYERFFEFEGIRYSHIMNPKTGWPVKGLISVSVHCPDAELADALATSVFVMGKEKGLALLNSLEKIEGFVVDQSGAIFSTEGIEIEHEKD